MGKIPAEAKLVFKGVIFDVYQWQQKMFDGSSQTFEMLKRPNTVLVIPVQGEKIIIGEQQQPGTEVFRGLLGGRPEGDETPPETGKRELLEESGLVSEDWELYLETNPIGKIDWSVYIFIARDCQQQQAQKLDAGEKLQVQALTFPEFFELVVTPGFGDVELIDPFLRMQLQPNLLAEFKAKLWK